MASEEYLGTDAMHEGDIPLEMYDQLKGPEAAFRVVAAGCARRVGGCLWRLASMIGIV